MTSTAQAVVLDMRVRYKIQGCAGDTELERVLAGEGIRVDLWDFGDEDGLIELVIPGRIALDYRLDARSRRWVIAHGLAHHVLHRGNHLWLGEWFSWLHDRQERQSHEFAGWWFYHSLDPTEARTLAEAADQVGIPLPCFTWWYETVLKRAS